jgi:hypothetical protein
MRVVPTSLQCKKNLASSKKLFDSVTGLRHKRLSSKTVSRSSVAPSQFLWSLRSSSGMRRNASAVSLVQYGLATAHLHPIGQAHVLYHSGRDGVGARGEEALTQLRRDAQDLLDAIARVEAAVKAPETCLPTLHSRVPPRQGRMHSSNMHSLHRTRRSIPAASGLAISRTEPPIRCALLRRAPGQTC